jgi:hypothetical protein
LGTSPQEEYGLEATLGFGGGNLLDIEFQFVNVFGVMSRFGFFCAHLNTGSRSRWKEYKIKGEWK